MNFYSLVKLTANITHFDLPLLVQAFDDPRESIRVQLSRWNAQGKIIGLRRGVYTLAEPYRNKPASPSALANAIYRPSYLSGLWALSFYDMIPERVNCFTSVSTRSPQRFENPMGLFDYRNVKQEAFFGYRTLRDGTADIIVADPEKALLDHWHLTVGEWTNDRLEEMRYQHTEQVDAARLNQYAERYHSPRLERAANRWLTLVQNEEEGTLTL